VKEREREPVAGQPDGYFQNTRRVGLSGRGIFAGRRDSNPDSVNCKRTFTYSEVLALCAKLLFSEIFSSCSPLTEEEKDRIYHRVINEKHSPALVAAETGHSVRSIRKVIKERGGKLPLKYTVTLLRLKKVA
jgi:hypothetical protein